MTNNVEYGTFGAMLDDLMRRADMNQEDLATAAQLHVATLSRLRNGHHEPTIGTLNKIGFALKLNGVDISGDDLLGYWRYFQHADHDTIPWPLQDSVARVMRLPDPLRHYAINMIVSIVDMIETLSDLTE